MAKKFISIEIDDKALNKQLRAALRRNPSITSRTISSIALDLQGKSARRAPVDTGDLRNNCNADITKHGNLNVQAKVGYSLPYALRQHEELGYNHPKGGEAKFLEKPFEENKAKYIKKISEIPDEVLK